MILLKTPFSIVDISKNKHENFKLILLAISLKCKLFNNFVKIKLF